MAALDRKDHLPEPTDGKGHQINRQEIGGAQHEVGPQAIRVVPRRQSHENGFTPTAHGGVVTGNRCVSVPTGSPHTEEHGREGTHPDGNHHALEVDAVTHMRRGLGYTRGRVENRIHRLIERIPLLVLATLVEMRLEIIECLSNTHHQASFSIMVRLSRKMGPYSYLPGHT